MILVFIDMPHKSELINFNFSVRLLSTSIMAFVDKVGAMGTGSVTTTVGSVASGVIVAGGGIWVVLVVVVGVYLGDGGRTMSLTIFGGCGSIELGKSNSTENDGGQFLFDLGSSKCAKKLLPFLWPHPGVK